MTEQTAGLQPFTLYWRTGDSEVVRGRNIAEAMTLAGYGGGAIRVLDFYATGSDHSYKWNKTRREWESRPQISDHEVKP